MRRDDAVRAAVRLDRCRPYGAADPTATGALPGALFFPLFIVEFATVSLLALLPPMRITRGALYALAAMFAVFALRAVFGFGYPNVTVDWTLNVISKILCFVAAILLFVWKAPASAETG